MAQMSVLAPILTKMFNLAEDPITDNVISWNKNGTAFIIWKTTDLAKDLLHKYFKHNNFSSSLATMDISV